MNNFKEFKPTLFGFGFFIARSPSLNDPAGLYRWVVSATFGFWIWKLSWHSGIGTN